MDEFEVPHKVNQHVFKALFILQPTTAGFVSTIDITKQVKMQMRDCNEVLESDDVIQKSLSNLTKMGMLACTGNMDYALQHTMNMNTNFYVVPKPEPKKKKSLTRAKASGAIPKAKKPLKPKTKPMKAKTRTPKVINCTKSLLCVDCVQALLNFSVVYKSLKTKNDANVEKPQANAEKSQVEISSTTSTECLDVMLE